MPPIGGPDPVEIPSEPFKNGLSKLVAISGGCGAVIRRTVAFHPQEVLPRRSRIRYREIDSVTRASDLMMDLETSFSDAIGNHRFKLRIGLGFPTDGEFGRKSLRSSFRIIEEILQVPCSAGARPGKVDLLTLQAAED